MNEIKRICKSILLDWRDIIKYHKFHSIFFLIILPLWIMYCIFQTYYDETTKNAVMAETTQIVNFIGKTPEIEYENTDKICTFCANVYIKNNDFYSIKKFDDYLIENGYKRHKSNRWSKKKYVISRKYNGDHAIYTVQYLKNKLVK